MVPSAAKPPKAQELRDLIAWLRALLTKSVTPKPKPAPPTLPKPPRKVPPRPPGKPAPPHIAPPFKPLFGIDYAWGNPSPSALRKAGVSFVCRYLSTPPNSKNLRKLELAALRKAGLAIVTVWETTAKRARAGRAAGKADAKVAAVLLAQLGAPKTAVVYFAVDWDDQSEPIGDYFRGAAEVLGVSRVGVYAGVGPCKRLLDAKLVSFAWQTYAWSGGQWEPRAHLRQFSNDHTLAGVSCDFDRAIAPRFGQW